MTDGWFRTERGTLMKRYGPPPTPVARGKFPTPACIADGMDPTQHIDGKHYDSKSVFRAVTKAHGCIEVGNDPARLRRKDMAQAKAEAKKARAASVQKAIAQSGL